MAQTDQADVRGETLSDPAAGDGIRMRLKVWLVVILAVIIAGQAYLIMRWAGVHTTAVPFPGPGGQPGPAGGQPRHPGVPAQNAPSVLGLYELAEGIVKMKSSPNLAVKSGQGEEIAAELVRCEGYNSRVLELKLRTYALLTPAQLGFIVAHRQESLKIPSGAPRGEDPRLWALMELVRRRSQGGAALSIPAGRNSSYKLEDRDLVEGILRLETQPSLALSPAQAASLAPLLAEIRHSYAARSQSANAISEWLSPAQLDYIRSLGGKHDIPPDRVLMEAARAARGGE